MLLMHGDRFRLNFIRFVCNHQYVRMHDFVYLQESVCDSQQIAGDTFNSSQICDVILTKYVHEVNIIVRLYLTTDVA
jgi:hypothetical protein